MEQRATGEGWRGVSRGRGLGRGGVRAGPREETRPGAGRFQRSYCSVQFPEIRKLAILGTNPEADQNGKGRNERETHETKRNKIK